MMRMYLLELEGQVIDHSVPDGLEGDFPLFTIQIGPGGDGGGDGDGDVSFTCVEVN